MRVNLSPYLLRCAARLSSEVGEVETENHDEPWGSFFEQVLYSASGCVVMAVASVEAFINETFAGRERLFDAQALGAIGTLWPEIERASIRRKFNLVAKFRGSGDVSWGQPPFQDFLALVELRNGLVHFTPEWMSEQGSHSKISDRVATHVTLSKWLQNEQPFPRAWASHATTKWAVETAVTMVSEFCTLTGIQNRFAALATKIRP